MSKGLNYYGVQLPELKEGELCMDALVMLKILDAEGATKYREFKSATLHPIEALGMSTTLGDTLRNGLMGSVRPGSAE